MSMIMEKVNYNALKEEFFDVGYVVARGIIPVDVAYEIADFITSSSHNFKHLYTKTQLNPDVPISLDEAREISISNPTKYQSLNNDLKHLVRGELPLPVRLDPKLRVVAHVKELVDLIKNILSCDAIRVHNPPSIRVSEPRQPLGIVPVHQDWSYNLHVSHFITGWMPLCAIDETCGGVDVLPKSQVLGCLEHEASKLWGNMIKDREAILKKYEKKHIHMALGDMLFFGPHLIHGSHESVNQRTRYSIDYRFFDATLISQKHAYDPLLKYVVPPLSP